MSTTNEKKRAVQAAEDAARKALEKVELAHWELDDATEHPHLPRAWKQLIEAAMCPVHEARHMLKHLLEDLEEQADLLGSVAELKAAEQHDQDVQADDAELPARRLGTDVHVEPEPAQLMGELKTGGGTGAVRSGAGARGGEGS